MLDLRSEWLPDFQKLISYNCFKQGKLRVLLRQRGYRLHRHNSGTACELLIGKVILSLILAGAVGNLIDRALFGFVTDMFKTLFMNFAVFNVADICVVCGAVMGAMYYLWIYEKYDMKPKKGETDGDSDAPTE